MKNSKFTEEQIAFALHQAQTGRSAEGSINRSLHFVLVQVGGLGDR